MKNIIKRGKKSELFDEKKLYTSLYRTCLSARESDEIAQSTAKQVTNEIIEWLEPKTEITTDDLRKEAGKYLSHINSHAGYLYLHHRIMW